MWQVVAPKKGRAAKSSAPVQRKAKPEALPRMNVAPLATRRWSDYETDDECWDDDQFASCAMASSSSRTTSKVSPAGTTSTTDSPAGSTSGDDSTALTESVDLLTPDLDTLSVSFSSRKSDVVPSKSSLKKTSKRSGKANVSFARASEGSTSSTSESVDGDDRHVLEPVVDASAGEVEVDDSRPSTPSTVGSCPVVEEKGSPQQSPSGLPPAPFWPPMMSLPPAPMALMQPQIAPEGMVAVYHPSAPFPEACVSGGRCNIPWHPSEPHIHMVPLLFNGPATTADEEISYESNSEPSSPTTLPAKSLLSKLAGRWWCQDENACYDYEISGISVVKREVDTADGVPIPIWRKKVELFGDEIYWGAKRSYVLSRKQFDINEIVWEPTTSRGCSWIWRRICADDENVHMNSSQEI